MEINRWADPDFLLRVAQGLVPGYELVDKFGENPDIDGTEEAVWDGGGAYTGHDATAAETVEILSTSADDVHTTGTGARTATIYGLDGAYAPVSETVNLNGTTGVTTTQTFLRVFRLIVNTAGSGGENAGTLTARQSSTTANVFTVVPIGYNQSMVCAYTIPAGKTGYLLSLEASLSNKTSGASEIRLAVRPDGGVFNTKDEFTLFGTGTSADQRVYKAPKTFPAKSDVQVLADADTVNMAVSAEMQILLVDD